jgi:transcriptional regulator with XRE-family HTH domain
MRRLNVIGPNVTKFRHQRNWTQNRLAEKLQLLGCNITPQILANIEVGRTPVTDGLIVFLTRVFSINVAELFPEHFREGTRMMELAEQCPTRRLRRSRFDDEPDSVP